MAKIITDGKLIVTIEDGQKLELIRPFEKIKYNYESHSDEIGEELELIFSAIEDNNMKEYYDFASSMKNHSITNVKFNYLLVDEENETIEEHNLFDSNNLKDKKIRNVNFTSGIGYNRNNKDIMNDLYLSTLMQFNFIFI